MLFGTVLKARSSLFAAAALARRGPRRTILLRTGNLTQSRRIDVEHTLPRYRRPAIL
jgi:hypothetical protein